MEQNDLNKLLLNTAVCCMACDGEIDKKEVDLIKTIFTGEAMYADTDFNEKLNAFVSHLNEKGKEFFKYYFDFLKTSTMTEQEELALIDIAIKTINADEKVEYSEVKFFKVIRHHLKISDEAILAKFPDIEFFLEEDIITDSYLDKITDQFFGATDSHGFEKIKSVDIGNLS
jgi:uncharacterized tellurite resistance protein B-like protein